MVLKRTKMWPLGEIKTNKWKFHKFSNGDKNLNLHVVHPDSSYGKDPFTMQCRRPLFNSWVGLIRWRRDRLPAPVFLGFPCDSAGKEPTCNVGDMGSVPGLGRSPGEGKDYPLQYSGLENSMDCIVHGDVIAYGEWCRIRDVQGRFSFGTRDQALSLKSFCIAEFY